MAAAVVLSADSPAPAFAGGGVGVGGSNFGPAGPTSWSRSLDRSLEEAAITGSLNLCGRKLKEFPRSANNHDLSDTTRADLSRNRLPELPPEVCHFVSLESLNLYQNCLRQIPDAVLNLQSLTYLNVGRNQLSTLPAAICCLPLKVLIACNNKLVSLPEEIGRLQHLTELDVSCNEIQTLPTQMGQLEALRDLNIRRNHVVRLPEELSELPLVRIDFSCNKITSIPVCYRNLRHLQTITLENNPLQSPPAQVCIKGKVHIFKFLNMEACRTAPDLPDYDRRPMSFGSCHEDLFPSRSYGALDSGFNSVDSCDKRWSGNEPAEEFSDLPLRVAEITKEQRLRRESQYLEKRSGVTVSNGGVDHDLEQIDFIDNCPIEEEEEKARTPKGTEPDSLSSQFMAYIERRISHEGKASPSRDGARTEDSRRFATQHVRRNLADGGSTSSFGVQSQCSMRNQSSLEQARREAQLAALQYEEERQRTRQIQRDAVLHFVKHKAAQSPSKLSPTDSENGYQPLMVFEIDSNTNTIKRRPETHKQSEDRSALSPGSPFTASALHSPTYPVALPSHRSHSQRPENFLMRAALRDELRRGGGGGLSMSPGSDVECVTDVQRDSVPIGNPQLAEQLRKNIESRLKVSLPSDLGSALTDGVVLCHLANHVRPRSVSSIHVPSPAVPKLTMAKCRRNVENFLEACRKIGVPQERLCSPEAVLEGDSERLCQTLEVLLSTSPSPAAPLSDQLTGFALFYVTVMSLLCALYFQLALLL
ncbi:DISP complex protein LRCH3 isoform X2 [Polypterus senegalus]|uniref:DISP complex protein LRCH3 isoform X2 n=1 Tax=Polypterus senegalus TaxID=55291 RepID=UPI001964CD86|nr:DISP complex protein LRCH3 isoform X2 [Polypterus senegalus]